MKISILIVEDEPAILLGLEDDLSQEGYEVHACLDGESGLNEALSGNYDLILLDLMLPKMDGMTICKELRQKRIQTPIIMLTAKSQEIDKIIGLEFGADDYMTKPFSLRELQARIKAVLRRSSHKLNESFIRIGDLQLNKTRNEGFLKDRLLDLTHLEFNLLYYLAQHEGKVLDRYQILEDVWNDNVVVSTRTVDTHIASLRKKLDTEDALSSWIIGVRGVGYKFVLPRFNKT